jgi:hypothetical protein
MIRCRSVPTALDRDRLARVMRDRDADEIAISHNAARRIEIDPARTGHVRLAPSGRGFPSSRIHRPRVRATLRAGVRHRFYLHGDLHGQMIRCRSVPTALDRDRLARVMRDRDALQFRVGVSRSPRSLLLGPLFSPR